MAKPTPEQQQPTSEPQVAAAPPAATQQPQPQPAANPTQNAPVKRPTGGSLLSKSISIQADTAVRPTATQPQKLRNLTQGELEQLWQNAGKDLGLTALLSNATLQLQDNNHFIIEAQDTLFDHDFLPHKLTVLQHMRQESGLQLLDCSIKVRYVEKSVPIHTKEEKFASLVAINPAVIELRKLLPDIEI